MKSLLYKLSGLGLVLSLLALCPAAGQAVNHKAHSVFLFNFARYAEYPASANNEVIRFGILGSNGVFEELDAVLKAKLINGKKCVVERVTAFNSLNYYHIIFVADGESSKLDELLAALGTKPTLVVTERDNLVRKGAAISFFVSDDSKLRFQVNNEALSKSNIQLAASLRSLAQ